jgi:hypothetical protein
MGILVVLPRTLATLMAGSVIMLSASAATMLRGGGKHEAV